MGTCSCVRHILCSRLMAVFEFAAQQFVIDFKFIFILLS